MNDKCSDKTPALLTSTYRIRDKTSIIVHINQFKDSVKRDKISKQAYTRRPKNKNIILSLDVVTKPFEEFFCTQCENKADTCSECGCRRCLLKTGDPIVSSLSLLLLLTNKYRFVINVMVIGTLNVLD